MTSKLHTLILLSILLISINCACSTGYFTDSSPCDTKATRIQCKDFVSTGIKHGQWHYYYMSLDGIEGNIELDFDIDGPLPDAYIRFQPEDRYRLPTTSTFDLAFRGREGGKEIASEVLTHGMKAGGRMLLGLYNTRSSNIKVKIRYFTTEGSCQRPLAAWILGLIIGLTVAIIVGLCVGVGVCIHARITGRSLGTVRRWRIAPDVLPGQNNPDIFTAEDLQKYFPKKSFEKLENTFHQTGCSVCLEDFAAGTMCHQLYCNHIFHEGCVQKWLEKHNSCPECRVSIGKKAVEEFFKTKKKIEEKNIHTTEIRSSRIPFSPTQGKDSLKNEEEVQILALN